MIDIYLSRIHYWYLVWVINCRMSSVLYFCSSSSNNADVYASDLVSWYTCCYYYYSLLGQKICRIKESLVMLAIDDTL
jgi:hypothetical protein